MVITQAVNRIFWRFGGNGNNKPFPVNEQDIEAYNSIKGFVQQKNKEQHQNNEMFAKLFVYLYMKILENDKSTVLDNQARKKIYNLLSKPLFQVVEDFQRSLNESEQYELLESVQREIKHPATVSDEKRSQDKEKLIEALKTPENMQKLLGEVWDYETVKDLVEAEVNQALNTHL